MKCGAHSGWVGDKLQGMSPVAGRSWAPFKMAAAVFEGPF